MSKRMAPMRTFYSSAPSISASIIFVAGATLPLEIPPASGPVTTAPLKLSLAP